MKLALFILVLTLLAGCTRARDVQTAFTVYLQQYLEAVANCHERMLLLRVSDGRVRMPDDCEQPGPEDWEQPGPEDWE